MVGKWFAVRGVIVFETIIPIKLVVVHKVLFKVDDFKSKELQD